MEPSRPKYVQIKERLRSLMTDGDIDHRVPSENELAHRYRVSRMTARKALNELLREGLVERIPGKGTFVRKPRITQAYFHIHAFSENAKRLGVDARSQVIRAEIGKLPTALIGKIPGNRAVCIRRVHSLNGQPVCSEIRYLRKDWCASLLHEDLAEKSIHRLIVDNLLLPITRVWQRLEAVSLDGTIAEQLEVPANTPAFCMKQLIYSTDAPVSYVDYFLRSDVYAFEDTFGPGKAFSDG